MFKFFASLVILLIIAGTAHLVYNHESPQVFVGIIVKDNNQLIPVFLKSLENLDFDKKRLHLQFHNTNSTPGIENLLNDWIAKNRNSYNHITYTTLSLPHSSEKNKKLAEIKDTYLTQTQDLHCEYCFILSSDVFLLPGTLKYLVQKDKPIIAPLLRPTPEPGDLYRNFFRDMTAEGYYKDHPDYYPIASRQKIGTFQVPCVSAAYLIQSKHIPQLSFTKHFTDWDFLAFAKNVRENKVDQYVCNEKEFGFLLHFTKDQTLEEEKAFTFGNPSLEITPPILHSLLASHFHGDSHLEEYAKAFNFQNYNIYRFSNRDTFYVDDVNDYIKMFVIKQGLNWEEHIFEEFKKYVKKGSVALDIGGHIGTHTIGLSKLVGKTGQVHSFEPQSKMFCELAANIYLNSCENITLHHRALGNEEKWIEMSIPKEDWTQRFGDLINEGHGTVTTASGNSTADKAKMMRLDDLKLENVSFVKMDVEGFEMEVIKGGLETIKKNKPVMIIELFTNAERNEKIKYIESLGYTQSPLGGDDFLFIPTNLAGQVSSNSNVNVVWDGTFTDLGSLSQVNRGFTEQFNKKTEIHLTRLGPVTPHLPELKEIAKTLVSQPPHNAEITIRHSWPPNWQAPPKGKWVLIQPWELGYLPEKWVERMKQVDEIWAPTEFVKNEYVESGVPEEKVFVVPNGFDPSTFHPQIKPYPLATKKKYKFLFLGGTIVRKGADILLDSYLKNFTSKDDVCLVIKDFSFAGGYAGLTQEEIIKNAQKDPNSPEIIYLNEKMTSNEIASIYTACDCLVYPYRGEGFALPVLEAMACGLPVIVTEGGATDDFVTQECGWLIPSKKRLVGWIAGGMKLVKEGWLLEPDHEVLCNLMRWAVEHPEEGRAKGIAASTHAHKKWTWEKAAEIALHRINALK